MREHHKIVLTGEDVREAFIKYLDNHEPGGPFPNDAKIDWVGSAQYTDTDEVVVISWGNAERA